MAAGAGIAGALAGMLGVVAGFLTRNPTTAMVAIFGTWIGEKIAAVGSAPAGASCRTR